MAKEGSLRERLTKSWFGGLVGLVIAVGSVVGAIGACAANLRILGWTLSTLFPLFVGTALRLRNTTPFSLYFWTSSSVGIAVAIVYYSGIWVPEKLLVPSNEPNPIVKDVTEEELKGARAIVFCGGGVSFVTTTNQMIVISYNMEPFLTLRCTPKGASLSGLFFGQNNDVVAVLKDNEILANDQNILTMKKSAHELTILDKRAVEVLNLRFINRKSFILRGNLRLPDGSILTMTDTTFRREYEGHEREYLDRTVMVDNVYGWLFSGPPRKK